LITYPYKTHSITLPGNCNVAYVDEGKGEQTIVFVHGLANYAPVWKKNIDFLKQYYRCIAIDLPGNGLSDQNEHPFSMRFFAETVNNFIQSLGLKKVCLTGHSMGGQVVLTTLIHYPLCADTSALCAPAGFETFSALDKTMYYATLQMLDHISSDEHSLRNTMEHSFYHHRSQAEGMIKELTTILKTYKLNYYRKMIESCIRGMLEEPVFDKLSAIKQRTLVIFGNKDALIPNKLIHHTSTEKTAEDGVKLIPNATLRMIPDCGHFVQWEKADEVNKYIHTFLSGK
jgi:pimeloyl-ACP methyl ester carboxylesterase